MTTPLAVTLTSVAAGLGLAAACGFRVFLPLAGLSIAATLGHLPVTGSFAWLATTPALIALATATVAEIAAYYVPWLDHGLDLLAGPAAIVAGIVAAGAIPIDLPPFLRWAIVVIGGGSAGLIQGATTMVRLKSGALTAGAGNGVVATGELIGAATLALLALLAPAVAFLGMVAVLAWAIRRWVRRGAGVRAA